MEEGMEQVYGRVQPKFPTTGSDVKKRVGTDISWGVVPGSTVPGDLY